MPHELLSTDSPLTVAGASGGSDLGGAPAGGPQDTLAWVRLGQVEAWVACGLWHLSPVARRALVGPSAAITTVMLGSWSGGWQWGSNRQISCLCVFATPFYKGKHNLKYDYLVL